jgi:hypothetical protein
MTFTAAQSASLVALPRDLREHAPPRPCADCGETEDDVEHCVACERPICPDCIAARNDEHGVVWCHECAEREQVGLEDDED